VYGQLKTDTSRQIVFVSGQHYRMLNNGGSEKDTQARIGKANYEVFRKI